MTRTYKLKRRAETQAETRQRIVEAAVDLHGTVGPANTTVSMIADRAGVQRNTYYSHFPDEQSLVMACSGHVMDNDPLPDPAPWEAIADPAARLRTGLRAIYDWYARHPGVIGCAVRDAEHHAPTRAIMEFRFGPPMARFHATLGAKLNARQRALLTLALNFHTWRTLTGEAVLKQGAAVTAMVQAILA